MDCSRSLARFSLGSSSPWTRAIAEKRPAAAVFLQSLASHFGQHGRRVPVHVNVGMDIAIYAQHFDLFALFDETPAQSVLNHESNDHDTVVDVAKTGHKVKDDSPAFAHAEPAMTIHGSMLQRFQYVLIVRSLVRRLCVASF